MRIISILFPVTLVFQTAFSQNALFIPPVLSGTNINLTLQQGTTVFYPPQVTNTMGANGNLLGPTLILQKDSAVSILVDNQLSDTTTLHWHGMHVSAANDGGPHIFIPPGTAWNPQFTVKDKAGAYWYHPHLHMRTDEHVSKGIAGLVLVRDTEEAAIGLPLRYGVDEFPLVLQTKGFDGSGQILMHTHLDTSVMVNGTIRPTADMPAQVVRFRVLNGTSQRLYEVGFSDNRSFSLIGTDGGLLAAPVSLTRYRMAPGQRADILVDLSADSGQHVQLLSYASELPAGVYGSAQPGMGPGATGSLIGYTANPLNGSDFQLLDIHVIAPTPNAVTAIPSALATFSRLQEGTENITRNLTFTSAGTMGNLNGPFLINNVSFNMSVFNYAIPLNNIEIWSLTNQTPISHPFHIHDVQFFILDINGSPPPPALQGYHDVVLVPAGLGNVRFIAQFTDFADDSIPYMYHCHMLPHEDDGMMGQFVVTNPLSATHEIAEGHDVNIYPNPGTGALTIECTVIPSNISVTDLLGRTIQSVPDVTGNTLSLENLPKGIHVVTFDYDGTRRHRRIVVN